MTILQTFRALERSLTLKCRCQPWEDAALCDCAGACACHKPGGELYLGPEIEPFAERAYAQVPHALKLGEGLLRVVRCAECGSVLRPNAKISVRHVGPGEWRHDACSAKARVPRGGRTLEKLLRDSVSSD